MLVEYLVKGLLMGIIFGLPAGALGAMTIQRTLARGFWCGFATGMGSTLADIFYASVSAFSITIIANFLNAHLKPIQLLGGLVIIGIGVSSIFRKPKTRADVSETKGVVECFLSALIVAILNPASFLAFVAGFFFLGITETLEFAQAVVLVGGTVISLLIWWTTICLVVHFLRKKITVRIHRILNIAFGICTILFGTVCIVKSFLDSPNPPASAVSSEIIENEK